MQQVELKLRVDHVFFCPVTGKQILFEDDFVPSKAMVFCYVTLVGDFFAYTNDWVNKVIIELGINIDVDGHMDYEDFEKIIEEISNRDETKNYVCFSITSNGQGTSYICIDMNYNS